MATTLSEIEPKVRSLLGDFSTSTTDIFVYGSSAVFTLTEENAIAVSEVARNDVASGVSYSYSASTNKVTISSSLTSGDTISVTYTYYPNHSSTEIEQFIRAALVHLSINQYGEFLCDDTSEEIHPELEPKDENILALVTAILIKPDNKTYRLPDMTIHAPNDLPTDQKISRAIALCKKSIRGIFSIN